jgi:hypothetical protein
VTTQPHRHGEPVATRGSFDPARAGDTRLRTRLFLGKGEAVDRSDDRADAPVRDTPER